MQELPEKSPISARECLEEHVLFQRFSIEERALLLDSIKVRELFPGEAICREEAPANEWYLLVEGSARVTRTRPDGGQERIAILAAGALFGVVGVLEGALRPSTVASLQPGRCLVFPRSLLEGEGRLTLCLGELICMALNHQLRAVNERLLGMARDADGPEVSRRVHGGWRQPASGG